jgi:hypothetical protein
MVQVKDTRLLNLGMDKDSDERFMPQGKYRDAKNFRLLTMAGDETYDPETGKIHSVDGHLRTALTAATDSGDVCIGAFKDTVTGLIYMFFRGSSAANNKIISFDEFTPTATLIAQNFWFLFNIRYPILDVYKFDDILIFNDAVNSPRQLDVTGSYNGYDNQEFPQAVNIIQKPPLYAPTLSIGSDLNFRGNNIKDKYFQFKYRYVYANNARSVFSNISIPAVSELDTADPSLIDTVLGTNNIITVLMTVDPADTIDDASERFPLEIELAVREGNNGDFFLVDTIDCSGLDEVTYSFYNDGVYTPISLIESNQLMDDMPHVAGAMTIANGRLVLGDVTRGFDDTTDIDVDTNIILRDKPTELTFPNSSPPATSTDRSILASSSNLATQLNSATWDNYTYNSGDRFELWGVNSSTDIEFGYVVVQSFIGETWESVFNRIITTNCGAFGGAGDAVLLDDITGPKGRYYNTEFDITITRGADSQTGFKSGEWYKAGFVYTDEWGRQQGVYTDPTMKFYVPTLPEREGINSSDDTNAGVCALGMLVNHQAPSWATRYKLAITADRVKSRSIMLTVSHAVEPSTNVFELELATLKEWPDNHPETSFLYQYEPGDRVRLIRKGAGGNWYVNVRDAEIVKHEERASLTTDTTYDPVPTITVNFASSGVVIGDLEGAVIEIYNPSPSIADDQGIWYEIPGTDYPVVSRNHYGIIQQLTSGGGIYVNRTPDALIDETTYGRVRINYNNSDFPILPVIGTGKLIISGLGTTDADWNATYDVTGYDVQESFVDVLVVTGTMPVGDATTSLTNCVDYDYGVSPAILTVTAFNAYGRTRTMVDEYTAGYLTSPHYIESQYMSDYSINSNVMVIGRPALVLSSHGEKRDRATAVYTEPYIFNTEINGLGRVYPDVNYEEYNHKFGAITKLFTRNDGILMLQEYKVSKLLVGRDMIYNADGGGQMTTSNVFLSKQIPFHGEHGCRNPESFASYGQYQFFADSENGTVMMVIGDKLEDIADTGMSKWFKAKLRWAEELNAASAKRVLVLGEYDATYDEYVLIIKDTTGANDTVALAFWMKSQSWISFMDYDADYMIRSFDRMHILDGEYIHAPAADVPGYLLGSYRNSTIDVVISIEPDTMKNFFALELDSLKAPDTADIETEGGQEANMLLADFDEREGIFYVPVFCDINTPNVTNPAFEGDTIKAKTAVIKLSFTNAAADGVKIATVSAIVSKA